MSNISSENKITPFRWVILTQKAMGPGMEGGLYGRPNL